MLKPVVLAMCIAFAAAPLAHAQYGGNNTADGSAVHGTAATGFKGSVNLPTSDVRMTERNEAPWGDWGYIHAPSNTTTSPTSQSTYQNITNNISGLPSAGSVTSSSRPFAGTYFAPSNIGLRTLKQGVMLPKTTLDSFVFRMGYNDHAFGDESTQGPPPYNGSWTPIDFPADGLDQHLPRTQ